MTSPSPSKRSQEAVLDRDFLEVRSRILELAAALDRHDRAAAGSPHPDPRMNLIRQGLEALLHPDSDRAVTVQSIFSLGYDPDWRERFGLATAAGTNGR